MSFLYVLDIVGYGTLPCMWCAVPVRRSRRPPGLYAVFDEWCTSVGSFLIVRSWESWGTQGRGVLGSIASSVSVPKCNEQIGRDGDMTWSVRSRDACPYVGAIVGNTRSCSLVHGFGPRSPRRRERRRDRRLTSGHPPCVPITAFMQFWDLYWVALTVDLAADDSVYC
jgi:hypothetical protein